MLCRSEQSICQSTEASRGMGNEKERNSRSIGAVLSLLKCARTKVKVGTNLSEELGVNVGVHQGSVLFQLLSAIVIYVFTNEIKEGMSQEILYVDDIATVAETTAELLEKCTGG